MALFGSVIDIVCTEFDLNGTDSMKRRIEEYETPGEGRREYRHGLVPEVFHEKYGVPMPKAFKLAAITNTWRDILEPLKIGVIVKDRLEQCTRSIGGDTRLQSSCGHRLCPWCNGYKIYRVVKEAHSRKATGITLVSDDDMLALKLDPPDTAMCTMRSYTRTDDGKIKAVLGSIVRDDAAERMSKRELMLALIPLLGTPFRCMHQSTIDRYLEVSMSDKSYRFSREKDKSAADPESDLT